MTALADSVETLPVFADKRVVMLNDLDTEKLDSASLEELLTILEKVPAETCIIIYITGFVPDLKKAKTKKLIALIEKAGVVLEFAKMERITDGITRRVQQSGCSVSQGNAQLLARLCLNNYTLIIREIEKLCAFAGYSGELTQKSIETLTARQLESGVFSLAGEITAKRGANSLKLLDELIEQGNPPIVIMSTLSMTFIDFYRAKMGSVSGKLPAQIAKDFNYAANRAWAVGKAMSAVSRMSLQTARDCVRVLCDADYRLKSSPVDDRVIMERAVAELLTLC
jgi:DNA polymerase-3 subunit delta